MATKWRLAKSLEKLHIQINAAHPNRSRVSDGSIGDAAHSSRTSDHNPDSKGRVCAIDITHDPANGVVGLALAEAIKDDARIKYIIFAGRIWKARTKRWEKYTGPNKHDKHVHVSVNADGADDARAWTLDEVKDVPVEATQVEAITKPTDTDKGVTTSDKLPEDIAGTPPPAPAAEVKASLPSLTSRLTSIGVPAGVLSAIGGIWTFVQGMPPWGWAVLGGVFVVALVIGAWLYNESMKRAQQRTSMVMAAAADKDSNNLRLI